MVRLLNRTTFSTDVLRIDPILYHIVYVQSFLDATSLHFAIQSRGSFDFFIRHVKVLVYVQSFSDSHTSTILSATPSLTTLIYNAHQCWDPPERQYFLDNSYLLEMHRHRLRSMTLCIDGQGCRVVSECGQ